MCRFKNVINFKNKIQFDFNQRETEQAKKGQKEHYPKWDSGMSGRMHFTLCACMVVGRDMNLDVLWVPG